LQLSDYSVRLTLPGDKLFDLYGPADLTKETTEAIVNAANASLLGGAGVDGAIHLAGGPSILAECKRIVAKIHRLPTGKAVITTGGRLPAKYVIHTVGPVYSGHADDPGLLRSCYRECVRVADDHAICSVAFPAISTGAFAYPPFEAARIALPEALAALESAFHVRHIRFVMHDVRMLKIYDRALEALYKSGATAATNLERAG
jgi:O-acetyl-ADP-ribose deacetylase (regulator of RNase III)